MTTQEQCPICREYDVEDESDEHMEADVQALKRIFGTPSR